jgi:hypothetical protein
MTNEPEVATFDSDVEVVTPAENPVHQLPLEFPNGGGKNEAFDFLIGAADRRVHGRKQ